MIRRTCEYSHFKLLEKTLLIKISMLNYIHNLVNRSIKVQLPWSHFSQVTWIELDLSKNWITWNLKGYTIIHMDFLAQRRLRSQSYEFWVDLSRIICVDVRGLEEKPFQISIRAWPIGRTAVSIFSWAFLRFTHSCWWLLYSRAISVSNSR